MSFTPRGRMDRGIGEGEKENPRAILKALFLVGILEFRQR
jgi:hypothetical protein